MKKALAIVASLLNTNVRAENAPNSSPIIFQRLINIDEKWQAKVIIREGQEPVDEIFAALRPYGVNYNARRIIFDEVKRAGVSYSREYAILFSQRIVLEHDSFSGTFAFEDNGSEPIDVIYNFVKEHSIESHFDGLVNSLLPKLCELAPCQRKRPRIWFNEVTHSDGTGLGTLEILKGDEAADIIDGFVQRISVGVGDRKVFRENLLNVVCKAIVCSRVIPVVFRKAIKDKDGNFKGNIEIFEDEEVIDAVVRFIRQSKLSLDEIALKNYMFQQACGISRLRCTRNVAVVYQQRINSADGSHINVLTIKENEEPADAVYRWCQENNVGIRFMESIMNAVCGSELVVCKRREPVYFSIPISGPDGKYVNTLELKVGHEPVDDIYAFFASNGLFKKGWDFKSVVKQICVKPTVDCRRLKALKHFDRNFTMGGVGMGQLVIWEDEEVVDVLYSLRNKFNLTAADQIQGFNAICKKQDVYCQRTRAIVFQKTDISKLDYVKFGNETCKRQFVGVKFRSTFVNMPYGSNLASLLKEDPVKSVVEHPLFCVCILSLLLLILHAVTLIPRLKGKLHTSHKIVISVWIIVLVSVMQASLVEPDTAVDQAMHKHEGKLPDLIIFEDEEPVDALLKWGKLAAKDHHPIVREPIYWEILDELCTRTESLRCSRTRAWEFLSMGAMTYFGQEYPIDFYNSDVDPGEQNESHSTMAKAAAQFCERFSPPPDNCIRDITLHIAAQLESIDKKRLDSKCSYKRLGLEMDAPGLELYSKAALVARERKMNISPFRRVDNGTAAFDTWSKETSEAHTAIDTFQKIHDPESREWNDKPCVPYFGGALCAKTDKDGNMIIEV
ncbi:hypothetical protein ACHAW5_004767 [Stephanodiscus triporus]|uniref:Uncharacterized protein n=1 Tax=Stephanodiscus triporus TaxID=2934178 RepID=A0ABD3Q708_9STRA